MSDNCSAPVLKAVPETRSGQKRPTSTPNIISGRCPRTEERHSRLCYNDRCYQKRIDSLDNLSEPSSVISEDVCHEEQATGELAKGARRTTTLRLLLRFMQGNHSNSRINLRLSTTHLRLHQNT